MKAMAAKTIRTTATPNIVEMIATRFGLFTSAPPSDTQLEQIYAFPAAARIDPKATIGRSVREGKHILVLRLLPRGRSAESDICVSIDDHVDGVGIRNLRLDRLPDRIDQRRYGPDIPTRWQLNPHSNLLRHRPSGPFIPIVFGSYRWPFLGSRTTDPARLVIEGCARADFAPRPKHPGERPAQEQIRSEVIEDPKLFVLQYPAERDDREGQPRPGAPDQANSATDQRVGRCGEAP